MRKRNPFSEALALVFVMAALILTVSQLGGGADAAVYKRGSSGQVVSQIQQRLKSWGYYSYNIDGVYGSRTESAVKSFQSANGLSADGVAGDKTLAAIGISGGGSSSGNTSNDVELLARVISGEARGEPYSGQVAVGAVILNRVDHPSFPNTLAGVVYQSGAFDAVADGQANSSPTDSARRAAQDALNGSDPSGGAIYYFNPATATNKWIWSRPLITTIGKHRFCA